MYGKGKGCGVPSDGQAREKLALYVYEYLLHVGAQKSAQTFLSEIRWEKNITLGEPPGFLHSWWCAAAAPSPVMGSLPPSDGMAGGPMPPGFFQSSTGGPPPVGVPGSQPLLPNTMDPAARAQGHPNMGGPMQRMNPPRGMGGMAPQVRGWEGVGGADGMMGAGLWGEKGMGMGMGWEQGDGEVGAPDPPPCVPRAGGGVVWGGLYSCPSPPPLPMLPADSTNSSENMYTMMNPIGPAGTRPNFPMGPGPEGPMSGMSAMEPHHMNGSLGGCPPQIHSSPSNMAGLSNPPGTPRDDAEMGTNFLNPFQSDTPLLPSKTMSLGCTMGSRSRNGT
uniref:Single stranded DNA binding protein 4 n=1 Tax=Pavo cristatus TaxID=9049 RepID=A0A8C9L9Y5_PAVCR